MRLLDIVLYALLIPKGPELPRIPLLANFGEFTFHALR